MYFWPLIFRQKAPLPALILSYIVARRFGKFRVIVNIADNRKIIAVSTQVIQKLHGVNGKNTVGSYSEAFVGFFNKHNVMRAGVVCRLLFGNRYIKPYIITCKHRHAFAVFHAGAKSQRISFNAYGFNKMPFYINAIYFLFISQIAASSGIMHAPSSSGR